MEIALNSSLSHQALRRTELRKRGSGFAHVVIIRQNVDTNMTRHMIKHSGVKVFRCLYCTKTFANKTDLISHEQHVHKKFII